jgi:multiple sugar transport system substrate-binding protein
MKFAKRLSLAAAFAAACCAATGIMAAEDFHGVTVNVMTFVGPQIAEPLQRRAPEFEKLTGAKIKILTVPFSDLYQKLLTDWASGTNSVDAAVFAPQWMVDYSKSGFLEEISSRIAHDPALKEDDVMPFFRDFSQRYKGKAYLVALDGDFQMVYYRTDILQSLGKQPPKTWDDYLDIAKAANGKVFGGDGKPVAGSCISKKRNAQAYWAIISIAGGYIQSTGTAQGAFFDPRDFKPLVDNDAFKTALGVYKDSTQYGPPNEINLDVGDTRSAFISGHCALTLDWGDVGVLAIDPKQSKVIDKVGAVILPGSTKVLNRDTGKLVPCDKSTCPYAVGGVNHAPFAAFGGWSGGINAKANPKVKDAAYAFLSFMSQPAQSNVDVTIGATGFNPYRRSQFTDMTIWKKAGMSDTAAASYLGAIKASLQSPNMIIDLRVPQNQRYEQVVLDTAVARFLAGELDADATMKAIQSGWDEITQDVGKDSQLSAYRASIGAK